MGRGSEREVGKAQWALLYRGRRAQAIRPEMDPSVLAALGEGTALPCPRRSKPRDPQRARHVSAVPEARGSRPPAPQRLAPCVASMHLGSEKSKADSRPCWVCGPGLGVRGKQRGCLWAERPPHHEAACPQADGVTSVTGWAQRDFSSGTSRRCCLVSRNRIPLPQRRNKWSWWSCAVTLSCKRGQGGWVPPVLQLPG